MKVNVPINYALELGDHGSIRSSPTRIFPHSIIKYIVFGGLRVLSSTILDVFKCVEFVSSKVRSKKYTGRMMHIKKSLSYILTCGRGIGEPRQAPLIGQQHLGRMPTSHRIGEGLGISYDHYGHNSSVYQQMGGDLMNIGLKDHSFEESSYGRPVMQDNFMPLSIPHGRNPFAQTNYNKRQNLQQLRFDAMGGSYKTAMNTVSDGKRFITGCILSHHI